MSCAIYFNLDGTLTRHDLAFEDVYADAIDAASLDALADRYEDYTDAFFSYFQNGWAFPRRQAIQKIMTGEGIDDTGQSDAFATAWEDAEADRTSFRDGAARLLQQLDGHALGVVTNGTGRLQRKKLEQDGVKDLFDAIVISSEIGTVKPNKAFFHVAQESLDAETRVIVSHDLKRDLGPAKQLGFHTVWLSQAEMKPQLEKVVDAQAASLEEAVNAAKQLCG